VLPAVDEWAFIPEESGVGTKKPFHTRGIGGDLVVLVVEAGVVELEAATDVALQQLVNQGASIAAFVRVPACCDLASLPVRQALLVGGSVVV
jgi:hypothetical protein